MNEKREGTKSEICMKEGVQEREREGERERMSWRTHKRVNEMEQCEVFFSFSLVAANRGA